MSRPWITTEGWNSRSPSRVSRQPERRLRRAAAINVTEPDHFLYDGLVQRRIVVEGDKVVLRTFGIGNNSSVPWKIVNENGAGLAFDESADSN